ncbi:MAG: recombinase [Bacteroidetes bacterium]|jgi:integrase|nr:recombinase [Bacteroidota bacterium]
MNQSNKASLDTKVLKNFVVSLVEELTYSERHGTARAYLSSIRRLESFVGNDGTTFEEITPAFLKSYEQHLVATSCKRNTVSLYLRMLRSICNQASMKGLLEMQPKLFDEVFTGTDTAEKRAVEPSVIRTIKESDLSKHPSLEKSRDVFLLSFYLRGIPFVDLIRLKKTDISKGVIRYRRSKTGRLLTVQIEPCAQEIIKKYTSSLKKSPYLLPFILNDGEKGYKEYQNALRTYNLHLKKISDLLNLKVNLTSYVARHSWATAAYRQGVPVAIISESLGHASEKVTYTYLAAFENRTLTRANRTVISLVVSKKPKKTVAQMKKRNSHRWKTVAYDS